MNDIRKIVGNNICTLMQYAADHGAPYPHDKALAAKAKLAASTIARIKRGEVGASIDTLEVIAKAYKLSAWQLLIPKLDPAIPPVAVSSDTERALYWRIKSLAADFRNVDEQEHDHPGSGAPE